MKRSYLRFIALIFLLSAVTIASASRWQGLDEGFSVEYSSTDSIRLRWNASNVNAPYLRYLQRENPSVDELCAACWVAVPRGKRPSLTRVTGFPQNGTVFLGDPHCMRDLWMVPINVQMLTPALAEGNVTTGTITISFAVDTNSPSVLTRGISTVFSPLYHTFVPNFNDVTPNNNIFLPPQILVIAPATLVPTQTNPLTSWINWRKSLGWQVRVATLTEIGGNNVTTIQNWIQNAYNTWQNPPDAVYLVGDDSQIETPLTYTDDPSTIFSSGSGGQPFPGNYSDDNNYVRLDGPMWRTSMPDPLPDMLIGRMLAASVADVSTQGTKTAFYEQLPDTCTWLNRAVVGADQESETQRATKRWTANRMLENGTTYIDSLYTSSSGTNLNELIRTGRSVVNYRGSGWTFGWAGINYYNNNINSCQNNFKPLVITGIGCGVAYFNSTQQCFGELWMKLGTTSTIRGTAGFIGPTWNTHTQFNNQLDIGLYRLWQHEKVSNISLGLMAGKVQMLASFSAYYPTDSNIRELLRAGCGQYICLSDPTMNVQVSQPHRLLVSAPLSVGLGRTTLPFSVSDFSTGVPKENLLVSVFDTSGVKGSGITNAQGIVSIPVNLSVNPGYLRYAVTGIQSVPIRDSIRVTSNTIAVSISEFAQSDTTGIIDTFFSPGEAGRISFNINNHGVATGQLRLQPSTSSPMVQIVTSSIQMDTLIENETIRIDGIRIVLSQNYRTGLLPLRIDAIHGSDTVGSVQYLLQTSLPQIDFISAIADPTGNARLDRDEVTTLQIEFQNSGRLTLRNASITIDTANDTLVTIDPQTGTIDSLAQNAFWSSGMRFQATGSRYLPAYHVLPVRAILSAQYPTFQYRDTVVFDLMTGTLDINAPTRMSNGNYYAYESEDSLYTDAPEYEWHDVAPRYGGNGTALTISGSNAVVSVDVPIHFVYDGQVIPRITISADGWITTVPTTTMNLFNSGLPNEDSLRGMIVPWWDDLWITTVNGQNIFTWYDASQHRFIVQWDSISSRTGLPRLTFQVVFYDAVHYPTATGVSRFDFVYKNIDPSVLALNTATVGIESLNELNGMEILFDGTLDSLSHNFQSERAIRFTSNLPRMRNSTWVTPQRVNKPIPETFQVSEPYPNPFNPETQIDISLPNTGKVTVAIFDALGRQVDLLYSGTLNAGVYPMTVRGKSLSAGVYFVSIRCNNTTAIRKVVLLK